jgi:hypothetical protein
MKLKGSWRGRFPPTAGPMGINSVSIFALFDRLVADYEQGMPFAPMPFMNPGIQPGTYVSPLCFSYNCLVSDLQPRQAFGVGMGQVGPMGPWM